MNQRDYSDQEPIKIQMFGGFRITVGEHTISDTDTRTRQLWHLLQYLITFRDKTVSQEEIIQVMWPENNIENPANALKNLVYRIRTTFADRDMPYAREMIIYNRNGYQWNNAIPCEIDTELFESLCKQAVGPTLGDSERLEAYCQAIELYRGDFLPGSSSENWVIPISSYMRTLFFKSVYAKLNILERRGTPDDCDEVIITCRKTLIIDPLEEPIHRYLIRALHRKGEQQKALEHYQYVTEQFRKELGIGPSEAMQDVYREICLDGSSAESDMSRLQADLSEGNTDVGPFCCDYEVFKNIYRLEARSAARNRQNMYICMLTIACENMEIEFPLEMKNRAMSTLKEVIVGSLQKGDIFSRFSATQYVLLLPSGDYTHCELIISRILRNYQRIYHHANVTIHVKIVPLEPAA